ncbi:MAG: hypothetical protein KA956_08805 [Pyrinomonadaceae bacterium]|nr:hypothetical protein [Acidobacteriota bacterium]MBP7376565.1 hypothetical protein [Pyrinomonadaceae bacterium]
MKRQRMIGMAIAALFGASCWSMGTSTTRSQPADTPRTSDQTSATPTPKSLVSPVGNTKMTQTSANRSFQDNLPSDFSQPTDDAGRLLLREYGSVFVSRGGTIPPKKVVFKDQADVLAFQATVQKSTESIGGLSMTLQTPAMNALKNAIAEAKRAGLSIGPRGADSSRRDYDHTVKLWASRVNPGFVHWVGKGRVTQAEAARIKRLSPFEQVSEILKLEQQSIFFSTGKDKSIIYSVAPPGTSQHISMLALDVKEFDNARIRAILANHGWFQTVTSDLPHFTYLGVTEAELPGIGLKKVSNTGRDFWVPDI